jgi:TorA maturation chaperone TorD
VAKALAALPIAEEDILRANCYALLGQVLARAPNGALVAELAKLDGDSSPLGRAFAALGDAARNSTPEQIEREHFALFVGMPRGELLPYASYYLTGFLHEKPLANVRGDLLRLGIARAPENSDPEDHIAALCESMAGMIRGDFARAFSLSEQRAFFDRHLAPWATKFFDDLHGAPSARFYKPVATIGGLFLVVEAEAFAMTG